MNKPVVTDITQLKAQVESAEARYRAALRTKRSAAAEAAKAMREATAVRQRLLRAAAREEADEGVGDGNG